MATGYAVTLVAATLAISRSSLYYRKKPRGTRADRRYDEQIVVACGAKPAYGSAVQQHCVCLGQALADVLCHAGPEQFLDFAVIDVLTQLF